MEKPIKSVLICLIGLSTNLLSVLYIINVDMSLRRILCTRNCCYPCSALNSQKDLLRIITAEHKQELELTLSGVCRDTSLVTIVKIRLWETALLLFHLEVLQHTRDNFPLTNSSEVPATADWPHWFWVCVEWIMAGADGNSRTICLATRKSKIEEEEAFPLMTGRHTIGPHLWKVLSSPNRSCRGLSLDYSDLWETTSTLQ